MTTHAPRCPRCGRSPALRRGQSGQETGSVTYECRGCGRIYEIELADLAPADLELEEVSGVRK